MCSAEKLTRMQDQQGTLMQQATASTLLGSTITAGRALARPPSPARTASPHRFVSQARAEAYWGQMQRATQVCRKLLIGGGGGRSGIEIEVPSWGAPDQRRARFF